MDARSPYGQRCQTTEEIIAESGKQIIYVLSKVDLVPDNVVNAWNITLTKNNLKVLQVDNEDPHALGQSLKEQLSGTEAKIALIGYYNSGKKSLLDDLKESLSDAQNLSLLDNTGVIQPTADEITQVINFQSCVENLKEPTKCIEEIMKLIPKEKFLMEYKIANFKNPTQLLTNVCQSKGMVKKGSEMDLQSTARVIIEDWNNGVFGYFHPAPEQSKKKQKKFKGMALEQN